MFECLEGTQRINQKFTRINQETNINRKKKLKSMALN